jgi:hypothetical protein
MWPDNARARKPVSRAQRSILNYLKPVIPEMGDVSQGQLLTIKNHYPLLHRMRLLRSVEDFTEFAL